MRVCVAFVEHVPTRAAAGNEVSRDMPDPGRSDVIRGMTLIAFSREAEQADGRVGLNDGRFLVFCLAFLCVDLRSERVRQKAMLEKGAEED